MASSLQKRNSLKKYNTLVNEAIELGERVRLDGDDRVKREAADKMLEAVLAAPLPWMKGCYSMFAEYCMYILLHKCVGCTKCTH